MPDYASLSSVFSFRKVGYQKQLIRIVISGAKKEVWGVGSRSDGLNLHLVISLVFSIELCIARDPFPLISSIPMPIFR